MNGSGTALLYYIVFSNKKITACTFIQFIEIYV